MFQTFSLAGGKLRTHAILFIWAAKELDFNIAVAGVGQHRVGGAAQGLLHGIQHHRQQGRPWDQLALITVGLSGCTEQSRVVGWRKSAVPGRGHQGRLGLLNAGQARAAGCVMGPTQWESSMLNLPHLVPHRQRIVGTAT